MRTINNYRQITSFRFIAGFAVMFSLATCTSPQKLVTEENVVDIVTKDMDFEVVDTIPAGWHTFVYKNKSYDTHFFVVEKYPEGKTLEDGERELVPVFQEAMDLITEGKPDEGYAAFKKLPDWIHKMVYMGGSGLLSPGHTSKTTFKLDPGYYVLECYVKMTNGVFHSSIGMTKELVVSDDSVSSAPITPDVRISLSSTDGIVMDGKVKKGDQVFSVYFKDQSVYENFVGHDVHLVRVDETADINTLEKWMNWADPKGLISPPPEGFTFLGGVNDMPAGSTGYFKANLEPGQYVLIAEIPNASSKKMLRSFEVTPY